MIELFQVVITIVGSVAGAFLGVRVSIARLETRMASMERELNVQAGRLDRLEAPHFKDRS